MSIKNKTKDRDKNGRIKRKYTSPSRMWKASFPNGCPKAWRIMYMTRPQRHDDKHMCHKLKSSADWDDMAFHIGSRKPHVYYW
jgi:hypothetical protein